MSPTPDTNPRPPISDNQMVRGSQPRPVAATYTMDALYVFNYYRTRDAFEQDTGTAPPPFDSTKPPKYWFDPAATTSQRRVLTYDVLAVSQFNKYVAGADGKPYIDTLALLKAEAASVNIPDKRAANEPGVEQPEIAPPLRPLTPDEELVVGWGGIVTVRNKKWAPVVEAAGGGFTAEDRAKLRDIAVTVGRIADKLGA